MSQITENKITILNLHTDVIKTKFLDRICLKDSVEMTIEADKCDISLPSKWKLKIEDGTQIFETYWKSYASDTAVLSIVPQSWKLLQGEENPILSAYILNNAGRVRSSNEKFWWSKVTIYGINEASLEVEKKVRLQNTSSVTLELPDGWQDGLSSNSLIQFGYGDNIYKVMWWQNACPRIPGTSMWFDSYTKNSVITLTECYECPFEVTDYTLYDTIIKIE